jgi:hypothetical protein
MFQIIVSVDTVIGTLSDSTMTTSAFAFRWYGTVIGPKNLTVSQNCIICRMMNKIVLEDKLWRFAWMKGLLTKK